MQLNAFLCLYVIIASTVHCAPPLQQQRRRFRRQPFNLPMGYSPLSFPDGTFPNPILPTFPFNTNVGEGFDFNPGTTYNFNGNLNFPIIDNATQTYYPFALNGGLKSGTDDIGETFGVNVNPTNAFDVPVDKLYPCLVGLCGGGRRRRRFAAKVHQLRNLRRS